MEGFFLRKSAFINQRNNKRLNENVLIQKTCEALGVKFVSLSLSQNIKDFDVCLITKKVSQPGFRERKKHENDFGMHCESSEL